MSARQVLLLLLVAVTFLLKFVKAVGISIAAHEADCYFEDLQIGDRLFISFQVEDEDIPNVDFWISNPNNVIASSAREGKGAYSIAADTNGRYTYCFSNKMSGVPVKAVNFNSHVNLKNELDENNQEDPLRVEIEELAESILAVKAEQEYIVARERRHRDTAESTNDRVKWWSIAQLVMLVAVCGWQIHYIKHFFEVKRSV